MAAKATEYEKMIRVHDVFEKLVNCWPTADIVQYAAQKWGVQRRQTDNYIAEAREKLNTYLETQQSEWVAQKMTTLERMARAELDREDSSTHNRLAALQVIRTQAQFLQVIK
jgi:hypothetical protein